MKLALQAWQGRGQPERRLLLTVRGGYHGDTAGAMSVCDPVTGMHGLFRGYVPQQLFVGRPRPAYDEPLQDEDLAEVRALLADAGARDRCGDRRADRAGRRRHALLRPGLPARARRAVPLLRRPRPLRRDRHRLRPQRDAVRAASTPASSRTSCAWARRSPAATSPSGRPCAPTRSPRPSAPPQAGPSCTGPPSWPTPWPAPWHKPRSTSSCTRTGRRGSPTSATDCASDSVLRDTCPGWSTCACSAPSAWSSSSAPVDMSVMQPRLVAAGAWVRPFGRLVYTMPPYISDDDDLDVVTAAIVGAVSAVR